jgi:branched-chain amino acid transport system permease protein
MVSFGHGLFYGLGAYSFALLMQKAGTSIPAAFAITIVVSGAVAAVIGAICIRLKEIYFSFLTLAFQMLLHSLIIAWTSVTGGDQGLTGGVPRPPFLGIRLDEPRHLYLFCCVVLVLSLFLMRHLMQSPFGYTLRMVRDNPRRTEFLGIQVWRVRLLAFVVAGIFGGVGGMLISLFVSSAYPDFAYWTVSGEGVFMILLGGMNVFLGPLIGAGILLLLNDLVTRLTEHYSLVLGIVILVFALGLRKGLLGFISDFWNRRGTAAQRTPSTVSPPVQH